MSGARERMAKEMMQRSSGESHQRQRRNQKDSNDLLAALTNTDELQLTGFDCSDYNIGRNQFPDEDGEEQHQEQEPEFADSNEDLLDHGGEDSNDLGLFDLATLCLVDADAEDGPDLHLCKDISKAKGQVIPYEYRVYLSKTVDDDDNKEEGSSPVAVASKAGANTGSSTADTSRIGIVRDVERRMMAHVASKMGLADCDSSTGSSSPLNRALRRRSLGRSSVNSIESKGLRQLVEDSQSPLIGISSDPVDGIADCPENSPNLPFHCMYVKGHLAAYFDGATDDAIMSNYANVIVNQISVGMETDVFIDERAKLLMYIPPDPTFVPTIPSREEGSDEITSENLSNSSPTDNETRPQGSSSNMTYVGIGVGCVVASVFLLSLFVFMRRRRIQKFMERSTNTTNTSNKRHQEDLGGVSETQRARDGDDSYCIEVEVSDNETVAMSVNKDGHVGRVSEKADSQGTAATEDDCETIATQESGVTLYLDMKRVGSDVSALTWYGPNQTSNRQSSGSLGRGLEAIAAMGAIQEDEEEEEEDDLNLEISMEAMNSGREGPKNQSKSTVGSDSLCYSSTASSSRGIV